MRPRPRRTKDALAMTFEKTPPKRDTVNPKKLLEFMMTDWKPQTSELPAPHPHAARRSEDIENARSLTMSLAIEVHQIRGFVSTLVPDHAQERHSALLALLRPGC